MAEIIHRMGTDNLSQSTENPIAECQDFPNKVVVLTVDRLGAGFLGPYGNTWIETPAMNLLASQSVLFENCFIDSATPHGFLQSLLTGIHAAEMPSAAASLPDMVREQNGNSLLITDDRVLAESEIGGWFDEVVLLAGEDGAGAVGMGHSGDRSELDESDESSESGESGESSDTAKHCDEIEDTQLARLFAGAIQSLEQSASASLIWIHARGMAGLWDAPLELRNQYADEDDPIPPAIIEPPSGEWLAGLDPDQLLGLAFAYAGQVCVLDMCLAALIDRLEELFADRPALLVLAGTRGYPLGEHGFLGDARDDLHEELIHVPLMIRAVDQRFALIRVPSICQPSDLRSVCQEWLSHTSFQKTCDRPGTTHPDDAMQRLIDVSGKSAVAVVCGKEQFGIRTPAWYLRKTGEGRELYVKPDDRWEVNEVSNRCASITAELANLLDQLLAAAQSGKLDRRPKLTQDLAFFAD